MAFAIAPRFDRKVDPRIGGALDTPEECDLPKDWREPACSRRWSIAPASKSSCQRRSSRKRDESGGNKRESGSGETSQFAGKYLADSRWASELNLFRPGIGPRHSRLPTLANRETFLSRLLQYPGYIQCPAH